jgi:hypothetical protein
VSKATAAYNLGYYEDAARHYEEAYRLILDPTLLFNIGQAYRLAGKPERAITAYRSFLRTESGDATTRALVEKRIQELDKLIIDTKQSQQAPPPGMAHVMTGIPESPSTQPITPTPPYSSPPTTLPTPPNTPFPPTYYQQPPYAPSVPTPWTASANISERPGYHQHDGFFSRFHIGGGYLTFSGPDKGSTVTIAGPGFSFSTALGWALTQSLIVYGEMVITSVTDPTVSVDGTTVTLSGKTASMIGGGPGFAYYLMPMNLYLSATLIFPQFTLSDTETDVAIGETNTGIGFSLAAGKAWWVSSNWSLGGALQIQAASMQDKGVSEWGTGLGVAFMFSATYN